MTTVREGSEKDLERLAAIKVLSWKDTYAPLIPPDVLSPFLDREEQVADLRESSAGPGSILLVAEDESEIAIGFALTFLDHGPDPWLESLHVHPDFRSHGAGTLLMQATARAIRSRGRETMRLGVVEGNVAAERFYERLGGIDAGREPTSWAEGVNHHIYRWPNLDALV